MNNIEVKEYFSNIMREEQEVSAGIAAIRTLLKFLEHDKSETVQELGDNLKEAVAMMTKTDFPTTSVVSGSELFLRFITLASLDKEPFADCKQIMLHRGEVFLKKLMEARAKVAKLAAGFITDGSRILAHSKSRVVLQTMKEAANSNRRFQVYVTISSPDCSGEQMAAELNAAGIPCTVILDSAVGYVMEQVDMVMVGAEGVVESGGIINKVGSFTMAMCAKEMKKPFYVLTESFKFARLYPLNQSDLPKEFKHVKLNRLQQLLELNSPASDVVPGQRSNAESASGVLGAERPQSVYVASMLESDLSKEHPLVDYTPPAYITLLFTDLGILTPSAVSDELIKLYL